MSDDIDFEKLNTTKKLNVLFREVREQRQRFEATNSQLLMMVGNNISEIKDHARQLESLSKHRWIGAGWMSAITAGATAWLTRHGWK